MRAAYPLVVVAIAAVALAAGSCATGSGAVVDDWSRVYVETYERVLEACLDSLEDIEFYIVEADRERGRVRAEASASRGGDVALVIRLDERPSSVRVDVMAQGSSVQDGRAPARMNAVVVEFLTNLDARVKGRLN